MWNHEDQTHIVQGSTVTEIKETGLEGARKSVSLCSSLGRCNL